MGALNGAAALTGHAVTASRVGEPQVLQRAWEERKQWVRRKRSRPLEPAKEPLLSKLGPDAKIRTSPGTTTPTPDTPDDPGPLLPVCSPVGPGPQGWGW